MSEQRARQTRWAHRLVGVIAVTGACASAQGDSDDPAAQTAAATPDDAFIKIVNVNVTTVEPTTFQDFIRVTGEAAGYSDVTVSADEAGVITRYHVDKGDRVERGQVLAEIDHTILEAQIAEARASAELAREQYERQRRLWEDEGIGSEITYLQAKYQADIQRARLETLEARLEKTQVRSPITGVFDERFLEAGERAGVGDQIARIVELSRIKILGGVPERFAPDVRRNDPALITFDILPGREFPGSIDFVASTVNERNRTFLVEAVIENPGRIIKPQMVATLQLQRVRLNDVIVVPQEVVLRTENGYQVFVAVDRDGAAVADARPVRLGAAYGDRVVIDEGLEPGQRLITMGAQLVDVGSRLRIVSTDAPGGN